MNSDRTQGTDKPLFPPDEAPTPAILTPVRRLAYTAFWTLCVCAYILAIWCTLALVFGFRLLHFKNEMIGGWSSWPKEALFTCDMYEITSLAMIPLIIFLRRSRRIVHWGLAVWGFEVFWWLSPLFFI